MLACTKHQLYCSCRRGICDAKNGNFLDDLRDKLMEQIARPVQWTRCMQAMIDAGTDQFVECGAGKVLAGLIKRIDRKMPVSNIESPDAFEAAL